MCLGLASAWSSPSSRADFPVLPAIHQESQRGATFHWQCWYFPMKYHPGGWWNTMDGWAGLEFACTGRPDNPDHVTCIALGIYPDLVQSRWDDIETSCTLWHMNNTVRVSVCTCSPSGLGHVTDLPNARHTCKSSRRPHVLVFLTNFNKI